MGEKTLHFATHDLNIVLLFCSHLCCTNIEGHNAREARKPIIYVKYSFQKRIKSIVFFVVVLEHIFATRMNLTLCFYFAHMFAFIAITLKLMPLEKIVDI